MKQTIHCLVFIWVINGKNEHNVVTYDHDKGQMDAQDLSEVLTDQPAFVADEYVISSR